MSPAFRAVSILVPVSDIEAATRWYERFFGGPGARLSEDSAQWSIAGTLIQIAEMEPDTDSGPCTLLLEVTDLRGLVARVPFAPSTGIRDYGVMSVAEYRDPDGNRLVLSDAGTPAKKASPMP